MTRRTAKIDWVVLGPEPYFAECLRCGAKIEKMPMPCPMDAAIKYFEYAALAHEHCKEPAA